MLDMKEQAEEKIKSLQKLEPDYVLSWLGGLTNLEQIIVSNLYHMNRASTIKDIMNQIIIKTYFGNIFEEKKPELNFPFQSYIPMNIKDKDKEQSLDKAQGKEIIKKMKKLFKFPSFRRIDKSIQDLISMDIVLAREGKLENAKIKGLYYLNPIIRTQLNKIYNPK